MKKIGIFASGTGTNFEALADSREIKKLAHIEIMVCDKPGAKVIEKAEMRNIKTFVFSPKDYENKAAYEKEILEKIKDLDYIFLAGYMRILSKDFLEKFPGKIINIHPSLLPKYKGIESIKRAYEAGDEYIGVTIHYVNEEVDGGKILAQDKFKVDYEKSLDDIEEEVHKLEHKLYVKTTTEILKGEK
ncbi:phosphoribosylglycinamide formyltransferase [uncultured Anaerococcus sp.]|uniref:phosphoribosylglycinamide formyltransferase n=1 Tax=uncultured Anaerococcus sp. TaxID=293428 RepID=UPI0025F72318|nr:phosphoribosylglycinamide formyltransferase [uncultured Anaerococcus sp.]